MLANRGVIGCVVAGSLVLAGAVNATADTCVADQPFVLVVDQAPPSVVACGGSCSASAHSEPGSERDKCSDGKVRYVYTPVTITWTWIFTPSDGGGQTSGSSSGSLSLAAPSVAGTYAVTVTADDVGSPVHEGPHSQSFTVTVGAVGCDNVVCGCGQWGYQVLADAAIPPPANAYWTTPFTIGILGNCGSAGGAASSTASNGSGSSCTAEASVTGNCTWCLGGGGPWSLSAGAWSSCVYQKRNTWQGTGPACARWVSLAATGGGSLSASVSCSLDPGASVSASASLAGSCSSLGNANATLPSRQISISAAYNASNSTVSVNGNFGVSQADNTESVSGSFNAASSWSTAGTGTKSGSASYTVNGDRTYNGCTNSPYTLSQSAQATAEAIGMLANPSAISGRGYAQVSILVQ